MSRIRSTAFIVVAALALPACKETAVATPVAANKQTGILNVTASAPAAVNSAISVALMANPGDAEATTLALENAMVAAANGGRQVVLGAGVFRLTRSIVVPEGVHIMGLPGSNVGDGRGTLPTQIVLAHSAAGFILSGSTSLRYLDISYADASYANDRANPAACGLCRMNPTGATIAMNGVGITLDTLKIFGPYDAVVGTSSNIGRFTIQDVFVVNPTRFGFHLTRSFDASRLSNVHVWSPYNSTHGLPNASMGYYFDNLDALEVSNAFVFAMHYGIVVGSTYGPVWATMSNIITDQTSTGMFVGGNRHKLSLSAASMLNHHHGLIVDSPGSRIQVTGSTFSTNSSEALAIHHAATAAVTGSEFLMNFNTGSWAVTLADGLVAFTGNTVESASNGIQAALTAQATVGGNAIRLKTPGGGYRASVNATATSTFYGGN